MITSRAENYLLGENSSQFIVDTDQLRSRALFLVELGQSLKYGKLNFLRQAKHPVKNNNRQSPVWFGPAIFEEIMPDKVILDNKKSYLVYFDNFHFL